MTQTLLASLKAPKNVQVFMYTQGGCYGLRIQQGQRRVDERWYWEFMQASDAFETLARDLVPDEINYSELYEEILDEEREDEEYSADDDEYDDDDYDEF